MKLLDLTLNTPAENLALDEALLETAEQGEQPREILRLWESPLSMVVLGRSSRVAEELDQAECEARGVPILRRCSGGAAVVAGPGCLMYAVVLSYDLRPEVRLVAEAHGSVLQVLAGALRRLVPGVCCAGTSDLTVGGMKFSGNSLRCKRSHLLYHGTLLYNLPLELIGHCLRSPPRQPDYRNGRDHKAFLTNLGVPAADLRQALIQGWDADERCSEWPQAETRQLVTTKYSRASWNYCL